MIFEIVDYNRLEIERIITTNWRATLLPLLAHVQSMSSNLFVGGVQKGDKALDPARALDIDPAE
tara:strand:+ start:283 stop:474 length:192 start_codon:yes stop_codon:yes gene_type:complete